MEYAMIKIIGTDFMERNRLFTGPKIVYFKQGHTCSPFCPPIPKAFLNSLLL